MKPRAPAAVAALLCAAVPPSLAAQGLQGRAGLSVGWVRSSSALGTSADMLHGTVIGGEGRVGIGRVSIDLGYREGSIVTDDDSETRDYAEGHFLLIVKTVPGILIAAGPHAHAYITNSGTQRWFFWSVRLRGEHDLIAPLFAGYVELWRSIGADVNVSEQFERAAGGEVGMNLRAGRSPFWGRVGYGIERAWLAGRRETIEGLTVAVGFGRR
jgi:hypothetical protein